jgi:hypothetical protein
MGGYNERGWQPYKRSNNATIDTEEFKFGSSPDGLIRRGSMILAVMPEERRIKLRKALDDKAFRQQGVQKRDAQELKRMAAGAGLETVVQEGDDD